MNVKRNNKFRLLCCLLSALIMSSAAVVNAGDKVGLEGFESKMVSLNGLDFHYLEKGQGNPILFLHGFPFDSETWLLQMQPLSKDYHVLALDNRGYPRSHKPAEIKDYHLSKLVSDVKAFITKKFPDQKVVLVGHDWGATLAWTVAQKHPGVVEKLVAINAPPYNIFLKMIAENDTQQKAAAYIPRLKTEEFEQALVTNGAASVWGFGFNKLFESGAIDEGFKNRYFKAWNERGAITGGINWYRANIPAFEDISDDDYWPAKDSRVTVPTLLLWSDGEAAFVKDTFDEIPSVVDDLKVELIENAGHLVQLEHADLITRHIKEFVTSDKTN